MDFLKNYPLPFGETEVAQKVIEAKALAKDMFTADSLKTAFSIIDLTSLNATDQVKKGRELAEKVNKFPARYAGIPDVAAICVYPPLVKTIATYLKIKTVGLAAVAAGFPSSQTFIEVKTAECHQTAFSGATDIDIVISLGTWLSGDYETVFNEIKACNEAIGHSHLKVILETGALKTVEDIWNASIVAMEAGAEFIKTSTGKHDPAATPEAAYIMCQAIKAYHEKTGRKVGLKPAGGIVTSKDAILYLSIVKMVLGDDWLNKKRMRLGASRLANNLVSDIIKLETGRDEAVAYF
ncbi:MAG: deoxyribose-phosphate aldolase [Salinivirgaceae bacterium]|jgi:deoxyribose-phosphate aldolase|nr:deoxyribose-phosphate aldolase [Salinivirgaceae bacterium]